MLERQPLDRLSGCEISRLLKHTSLTQNKSIANMPGGKHHSIRFHPVSFIFVCIQKRSRFSVLIEST